MSREKGKGFMDKKVYLITILVIMIAFGGIISKAINSDEKYLVKEEKIEYSTICTAFVLKDETVIDIDKSKVFVPIIAEGGRVAKNEIIATYRGQEYKNYISNLEKMDAEIAEAMKSVEVEYSTELQNLDNQIINTIKKYQSKTSYTDIQESNTIIKRLSSKRAELIGEYSPKGAYIKELIAKRNEYEESSKTSNDNIKATGSGQVTYTIDGLEESMNMDKINKLNYEDLKEIIKGKKDSVSSIKITNNYEAYIMVKVNDVDDSNIELGKQYTLRLIDSTASEFVGELVRKNNVEEGLELVFKIRNKVENLLNLREIELEMVWKTYKGMVVPNNAIKTDGKNKYVTIIYGGKYIDVRINVDKQNSKKAVVSNIDTKQGSNAYKLEIYDQIVIYK